ncbi:hypothetical protein [uncultured Cellulomonas sp.]|uniref:hypothetical protein n=1 Tax=uncultured Cellulomonas sp. TaxID=189682 RepID=UPI0028E361F8|nr:hypothetical protein [uncultured Cellulomonas sp.]
MTLVTTGLAAATTDEAWYEVVATLGPLAAALGAIGALIVGILTVRQRTAADARSQWWARVQWAVDLSFSPDEGRRTVGFDALALLASSPLATPDDDAFLSGLSLDVLEEVRERGPVEDADFVPQDEAPVRPSSARPAVTVARSEVAAARLRVITDRGRGRSTPAWITRLAGTSTPRG